MTVASLVATFVLLIPYEASSTVFQYGDIEGSEVVAHFHARLYLPPNDLLPALLIFEDPEPDTADIYKHRLAIREFCIREELLDRATSKNYFRWPHECDQDFRSMHANYTSLKDAPKVADARRFDHLLPTISDRRRALYVQQEELKALGLLNLDWEPRLLKERALVQWHIDLYDNVASLKGPTSAYKRKALATIRECLIAEEWALGVLPEYQGDR